MMPAATSVSHAGSSIAPLIRCRGTPVCSARRAHHLEHVFCPDLKVIATPARAEYRTRKCCVVDTVFDQRFVDVHCNDLAEHEPSFDLLTTRIRQLRDLGDL